jgi:hypothetical protein
VNCRGPWGEVARMRSRRGAAARRPVLTRQRRCRRQRPTACRGLRRRRCWQPSAGSLLVRPMEPCVHVRPCRDKRSDSGGAWPSAASRIASTSCSASIPRRCCRCRWCRRRDRWPWLLAGGGEDAQDRLVCRLLDRVQWHGARTPRAQHMPGLRRLMVAAPFRHRQAIPPTRINQHRPGTCLRCHTPLRYRIACRVRMTTSLLG